MDAQAVIFEKPGKLVLDKVSIANPQASEIVVESRFSGISTGTEKLLWEGRMPNFPGMGYPLVPGYETVGEVIEDRTGTFKKGQIVFVPGSSAYTDVRGLFGGTASHLIAHVDRVSEIAHCEQQEGVLLALAATAHHALAVSRSGLPELVVGNGVLGQLIARLTVALGGKPPKIWETNPVRRQFQTEFEVIDPSENGDQSYASIIDVSGDSKIVDSLAPALQRGGEIVFAGFYSDRVSFAFPPIFMKEASFKVSAEWTPDDLVAVQRLLEERRLNLSGLVTHRRAVEDASAAYGVAFKNPECLKMSLDWKGSA